jgi:hypothetical protein
MSLMNRVCLITLTLWVVELSSGSSKRRCVEGKGWLNFDDVAHCRSVESFNAFVEQFLSERGLVGERARALEPKILNLRE